MDFQYKLKYDANRAEIDSSYREKIDNFLEVLNLALWEGRTIDSVEDEASRTGITMVKPPSLTAMLLIMRNNT